jgi:hypothetical protein
MSVWAVCKDPGGTNGMLPVVRKLREGGVVVELIVEGKAVDILAQSPERDECSAFHSVEQLLAERITIPKVLLTSMCGGGGIGRDLVPIMRTHGVKTVALQDYWGSSISTDWTDEEYRPDFVCENDQVGVELITKAWRGYPKERIKTFGYPALDRYATFDVSAATAKVRNVFGLSTEFPIVLFAGQLEASSHALQEVLEVLESRAGLFTYFFPRPHPRMKTDAPEEIREWQLAMRGLERVETVFDLFGQCTMSELIAASTIVISMYSTTLIEAACMRKQGIALLYSENGEAAMKSSMPELDEFPLVSLECCAKATTRDELAELITTAVDGRLEQNMRPHQEVHFSLDGKNATRTADFVKSLL